MLSPALRLACLLTPLCAVMATQEKLGLPEVEGRIAQMKNQLGSLPQQPAPQAVARVGFHSSFVGTTLAARWVQVDLGEAHDFESVVIVPAYFTPTENGSGAYGMPSRFRLDASDDEDFATYQTLLDQTETDAIMGLGPVFIKAKTRARFLRFTATRLAQQRLGRGFFALGELLVFSGELNIAAGCAVTCVLEGSRPLLAEVQALVASSALASPRRAASSVASARLPTASLRYTSLR